MFEGTHGDKYVTTLLPKETCTCAAVDICSHILAARHAVGLEDKPRKSVVNFPILRDTEIEILEKSGLAEYDPENTMN